MNKIKKPKIGEYVLVAKWSDKDPYDPWYIGFIDEILQTKQGLRYKVEGYPRWWKHCWRITNEEGRKLISEAPDLDIKSLKELRGE